MNSQKNVKFLMIGADIARTIVAGTQVTGAASLADGEVVVTTPDNFVVDMGVALDNLLYDKLKIIQRSGNNLIHSPVIDVRSILSYNVAAYVAPAQQVDFIGYNGVAGSIDVINNYLYQAIVEKKEDSTVGHSIKTIKRGNYKSGAAATQLLIASGLHLSLVNNFSREANRDIRFERCYSGALLNALGAATCTANYGSDRVVFNDDMTALVLVGTILRLGGTGAGNTPCYVVTGHDGGAAAARIYTLDVAYQGASAVLAAGNVESAAVGGNWGIRMTGLARPQTGTFQAKYQEYSVVRWVVGGDLGDTTTITNNTVANPGSGTWQQVADLEFFCQGNEGNLYRGDFLHTDRVNVVQNETYDVVSLRFTDRSDTNGFNQTASPIELIIARGIGAGDQHSLATRGYGIILDDWIVTNYAVPGTAVQIANFT